MKCKQIYKARSISQFVDLSLIQLGWEACIPEHLIGPAVREYYLFHMIISGKGQLCFRERDGQTKTYNISDRMGFLVCPDIVESHTSDPYDPWEHVWIEIGGLRAKALFETAGLTAQNPIFKAKTPEAFDETLAYLLHMVHKRDETVLSSMADVYNFLDLLLKASGYKEVQKPGTLKENYLKTAISFVENNYFLPINVESIANFCTIDRSYLTRIFKELVSETPQNFLRDYRISKAKELLENSTVQIGEVGAMVGYPNLFHFSSFFKKECGVSPKRWRDERMTSYVNTE